MEAVEQMKCEVGEYSNIISVIIIDLSVISHKSVLAY